MSSTTKNSPAYLFDPKSPLVFRTGRPFDQAGDPVSLDFPLPSTLAGACRTAIGDVDNIDFSKDGHTLKNIPVHGPLAALIAEDGTAQPLFAKPADAVYMRKDETEDEKRDEPDKRQVKTKTEVLQLRPDKSKDNEGKDDEGKDEDTWSDLANLSDSLLPVGLPLENKSVGKPYRKGATWWNEGRLIDWLLDNGKLKGVAPEELGWSGPQQELRTHVQLSSETLSAEPGQLFQTNNLSFAPKRLLREDGKEDSKEGGWSKEQYGLLAHLPDDNLKNQSTLFRRIGGEGRIACVQRFSNGWPGIPKKLADKLVDSKNNEEILGIRLILATPALFTHGWRPDWLDEETLIGSPPGFPEEDFGPTISLRLKAFVTPRWQPVSGWDLVRKPQAQSEAEDKQAQAKGGPGSARAVRRMVPAGAVYWFEVEEGHEQLPELWLQPVSDLPQDRNDGYGLVLPGIWKRY